MKIVLLRCLISKIVLQWIRHQKRNLSMLKINYKSSLLSTKPLRLSMTSFLLSQVAYLTITYTSSRFNLKRKANKWWSKIQQMALQLPLNLSICHLTHQLQYLKKVSLKSLNAQVALKRGNSLKEWWATGGSLWLYSTKVREMAGCHKTFTDWVMVRGRLLLSSNWKMMGHALVALLALSGALNKISKEVTAQPFCLIWPRRSISRAWRKKKSSKTRVEDVDRSLQWES